ncbi:hypothetical protein BTA51_25045 [Hahella sp. CCB-MM4]|uniref:hypothetical protein n=1 Tax=Hahella sp. (strain CCB-MM4) TaxID=1926491 RepID=UPI000B9B71CE|nr:hypothetical protein [Hahella sp. CCB-MM4]OZG70634.1 hypothetical protein BTA51_25045 [Hahella sp. CCB-MM4]
MPVGTRKRLLWSLLYRILKIQDQLATKKVLIALTILYPVFPLLLLPAVVDTDGAPILDTYFFYNADVVYRILAEYSEAARQSYMLGAVTVDVIYPVYYSVSLSLLLTYVIKPLSSGKDRIQYLRLLPFLPMVADFAENVLLSKVFSAWPVRLDWVADIAGYATLIKWSGLAVVFVVILLLAIINLWLSRFK